MFSAISKEHASYSLFCLVQIFCNLVQSANLSKNLLKLNMQAIRQSITKSEIFVVVAGFSKIPKNLSHLLLLFCSEPAKKFAKIDYARAQPSFCSLNLLLGDVPVSVAVLICLSSQ